MVGVRVALCCVLTGMLALVGASPADAANIGTRLFPAPRPVVTREVLTPPATLPVPVLMYHHISNVPHDADRMRRELTVTPAGFRAQLAWLRFHGYTTVDAHAVWSALVEGAPLPAKAIVLTFDDGYDDMYDVALPLLREFNDVGVFFVVVNLLDRPGYLTRDQVRAMADAGMDIESHGMNHVSFAKLTPERQRLELCGSRAILSMLTEHQVQFVAYPNGEAPTAKGALEDCGYRAGFGKSGGSLQTAAAPFALRRTRVAGGSAGAAMSWLLAR